MPNDDAGVPPGRPEGDNGRLAAEQMVAEVLAQRDAAYDRLLAAISAPPPRKYRDGKPVGPKDGRPDGLIAGGTWAGEQARQRWPLGMDPAEAAADLASRLCGQIAARTPWARRFMFEQLIRWAIEEHQRKPPKAAHEEGLAPEEYLKTELLAVAVPRRYHEMCAAEGRAIDLTVAAERISAEIRALGRKCTAGTAYTMLRGQKGKVSAM